MTYQEITTLCVAILGVILGVYNTVRLQHQDRVRLKVIPKLSKPSGPKQVRNRTSVEDEICPDETLCINVVNKSKFPIVISEIGFTNKSGHRFLIRSPLIHNNGQLPYQIDSRHAIIFYTRQDEIGIDVGSKIDKAYAVTECGKTQKGTSKALKQYVAKCIRDYYQPTKTI